MVYRKNVEGLPESRGNKFAKSTKKSFSKKAKNLWIEIYNLFVLKRFIQELSTNNIMDLPLK